MRVTATKMHNSELNALFNLIRHFTHWTTSPILQELFGAGVPHSAQTLGYRLDDQASIPGRDNHRNFSLLRCVQTGSGAHPSLPPNEHRGAHTWWSGWGVKLTTHLHLVLRSRMR